MYGHQPPPGFGGPMPTVPTAEEGLYAQQQLGGGGVGGSYPRWNEPPRYNQQPAVYGLPPPLATNGQKMMMYPAPPQQPPPSYAAATQPSGMQLGMSTMQPYPSPVTVVVGQQSNVKPQNFRTLAIVVTFLCVSPLGILAWINSCKSDEAYDEGNVYEARKKAIFARSFALFGIVANFLLLMIVIPITIGTRYRHPW